MKKYYLLLSLCVFLCVSVQAQNVVQGTVSSLSDGETLIGANVYEINQSSSGTTTDFDGNFTLNVSSLPTTIVVSYTGFSSREMQVNGNEGRIIVQLSEGLQLEGLTVTARKREETLKDVPIAITAISGAKLESLGAEDITATAALSPNVNFSYGGTSSGSSSAAVVYIRGVGQNDFVPTVDPGVGIYLDGVYLGRSIGSVLDLANTKRVEVLRGPQGTLFGRNTIGGAISLTSNDPTDEFEGNVQLTGGSFNKLNASAVVNVPFSETVKSSFSFLSKNRDGYVERLLVDDALGDESVLGFKGTLLFEPTEKVTIKGSFDYSREREESAAEEQLNLFGVFPDTILNNAIFMDPGCVIGTCIQSLASTEPFTTNETGPSRNDNDAWGVSIVADFELSEELSIKSISAYRDLNANFARSVDGTPIDVFGTLDTFAQNQFSQEIQLIGAYDNVDFVGGAYYFQEDGFNRAIASANALSEPGIIPVFPFNIGGTTANTSFAVFGEATVNVAEKLNLTGGLRWTTETKGYDPFAINALGGENVTPGLRELDFSQVTWRAIAAYDVNKSVNVYASASQGFKSGGFDVRFTNPTEDLEPTSFLPETVLSYEVGLKTYFEEANVRINIAAFLSDYENIQVSINPPGGIATRTVNGAAADLSGLEIEADWSPVKNLILDGSLGFISAEYTELADGSELSLDDEFIRTPTSTYTFGASYLIPLGSNAGSITPRVNLTSQNGIHFEPVNNAFVFEEGYNNINASLKYTTGNNNLSVTGGIINLTDERYLIAGDSNGTLGYALGVFALPRNWYVNVRYNF